jgi:hypothetical protein
MTAPAALYGLIIASICGFAFHFIRGGGLSRLLLYLATAWLSFFTGHFVGEWLNWRLARFGPLNLFPAVLAAIIGMLLASFLAGPEKGKPSGRAG